MTLADLGGALPWGALRSLVGHMDHTWALWRELNPKQAETAAWLDGSLVAPLLADVFDAVRSLEATVAAKGSGRKPRRPKPYPRPWLRDAETQHVGKDPIPISEFDAWWDAKGKEASNAR